MIVDGRDTDDKYERAGITSFYPEYDEGYYTKLKIKLAEKSYLAKRIDELGLEKYLFMIMGDIKKVFHLICQLKKICLKL